ncbi:hypothetical protein LSAT2_014634 [Lamellibrachia satsuma]|nr:hypothetical protein LSAT2_014634 [Lamellibrachia satsuma]
MFTDKENTPLVFASRSTGPVSGPVGKLFQSNQHTEAPTPRRALGNWNAIKPTGPTPMKPGGLKQGKIPAPKPVLGGKLHLKPPSPVSKHTKTKLKDKQKSKLHLKLLPPSVKPQKWTMLDEDKENMFPCDNVQDTFEDLWSCVERPSTYLPQLVEWRPTGLHPIFSSHKDPLDDCCDTSSDEDDDLDTLLMNDAVRHNALLDSVSEADMPSLDDILLQSADDLFLE